MQNLWQEPCRKGKRPCKGAEVQVQLSRKSQEARGAGVEAGMERSRSSERYGPQGLSLERHWDTLALTLCHGRHWRVLSRGATGADMFYQDHSGGCVENRL